MTEVGSERRPRRRRVLAVLVAGLSACAVGEVLARVFVGTPLRERLPVLEVRAHPRRGWEMVPGLHYTYEHPVHVNALGLRGPELGPKAVGELCVLVLGDSLTYGQGVADDETLPAWLERDLAARDPSRRVRVVNAGLRAYDTQQELALLDELGAEIEPDVVILDWYWNDFFGRDIKTTYRHLVESGPVAFDTGTRLEGWERTKWRARQLLRSSAFLMFLHDALNGLWTEYHAPEEFERGFAQLGQDLARLGERARALGALPLVALIPDPTSIAAPESEPSLAERVLALSREQGIAAVDLAPALRAYRAEHGVTPVLPFDGHYSAEGNRVLAASLAESVRALVGAFGSGSPSEDDEPRR